MPPWIWIPFLAFAVGIGVYATRSSRSFLRRRAPDQDRWRRLYPHELPRALATLEAICHSFGLRPDDVYRLEPTDRLYDIYAAAYRLQGVDALEFESLAQKLIDDFGIPEERAQQLGSATVEQVLSWTSSHAHT
jgi:hypothetical protein